MSIEPLDIHCFDVLRKIIDVGKFFGTLWLMDSQIKLFGVLMS